jgi:protein TonB
MIHPSRMTRYWFTSLVLHLLIVGVLILERSENLDDPLEVVEIGLKSGISPNKASKDSDTRRPRPSPQEPRPPLSADLNSEKSRGENAPPAESAAAPSGGSDSSGGELNLGQVTRKPRVLHQFQIPYPEEAKQARTEGAVRLSVTIGEDGTVLKVQVLEGPGHGLNEAAQQALQQFVFSPAEVDGRKVPVRITYVYRFRLESK